MAKRAVSAYWLWLGENRTAITKEHGLEGKRGSEVSKKAGELWKALGAADKKKYEDLAAQDKARYEQEVQTLGKPERKPKGGERASKKAKKDKDAPKRPMSAYFLWTQENRENIVKEHNLDPKAVTQFTKKAAESWKSVSDAVRTEYEKKAGAAKEQYQKDLEAYKQAKAAAGEKAEEDDAEGDEEQ